MTSINGDISNYTSINGTGGIPINDISMGPSALNSNTLQFLPGDFRPQGPVFPQQQSMQLMQMVMQLITMVMQMLRQVIPQLSSAGADNSGVGGVCGAGTTSGTDPSAAPLDAQAAGEGTSSVSGTANGTSTATPTTGTAVSTTPDISQTSSTPTDTVTEESKPGLADSVSQFLNDLSKLVQQGIPSVIDEFKGLVEKGIDKLSGFKDGFLKFAETAADIVSIFTGGTLLKGAFKGLFKGFSKAGSLLKGGAKLVKSGFSAAKKLFKKLF